MARLIETRGVHDGKCDGCGCDLEKKPPKFVFHGDGAKTYSYGFNCIVCGNSIVQEFARDRDDIMYYDDDEDDEE